MANRTNKRVEGGWLCTTWNREGTRGITVFIPTKDPIEASDGFTDLNPKPSHLLERGK